MIICIAIDPDHTSLLFAQLLLTLFDGVITEATDVKVSDNTIISARSLSLEAYSPVR